MTLPNPILTFTIPSIHDETLLDCRIYRPPHDAIKTKAGPWGAIVAHPYARLGGNYDDAVVSVVTKAILEHGIPVLTFNFRGAGGSKGSTSFNAVPETADYVSVAACFIHYLSVLDNSLEELSARQKRATLDSRPVHIIFGGYSYGSLIVNRLPDVSTIVSQFNLASATPKSPASEILRRAEFLAARTLDDVHESSPPKLNLEAPPRSSIEMTVSLGGDGVTNDGPRRSFDGRKSIEPRKSLDAIIHPMTHRRTKIATENNLETTSTIPEDQKPNTLPSAENIKPFYLLVSPLSNTVALAVALPFGQSTSADQTKQKLYTNCTLAVWGDEDQFSSSKKLFAWAKEIQDSNRQFEFDEFDGVSHFWREPGAVNVLKKRLSEWLEQLFQQAHSGSSVL